MYINCKHNMTFKLEMVIFFQPAKHSSTSSFKTDLHVPRPSILARSRKGVIVAMATASMCQPVRWGWHHHQTLRDRLGLNGNLHIAQNSIPSKLKVVFFSCHKKDARWSRLHVVDLQWRSSSRLGRQVNEVGQVIVRTRSGDMSISSKPYKYYYTVMLSLSYHHTWIWVYAVYVMQQYHMLLHYYTIQIQPRVFARWFFSPCRKWSSSPLKSKTLWQVVHLTHYKAPERAMWPRAHPVRKVPFKATEILWMKGIFWWHMNLV